MNLWQNPLLSPEERLLIADAKINRLQAENETLRDRLESILKSHADGSTLNVEAAIDYLSWLEDW